MDGPSGFSVDGWQGGPGTGNVGRVVVEEAERHRGPANADAPGVVDVGAFQDASRPESDAGLRRRDPPPRFQRQPTGDRRPLGDVLRRAALPREQIPRRQRHDRPTSRYGGRRIWLIR